MKKLQKYKGLIIFSIFILMLTWFLTPTSLEQKKDSHAANEMSQNLYIEN